MTEKNFVYDGNIEKLQETVARLNRRAEKLNVPAIQLHISEPTIVYTCPNRGEPYMSENSGAWGPGAPVVQHTRAVATLTGEPPKLAGWEFVAVVDHLSNGVITRYPGSEKIDLTPFRNSGATCDHCQTNRKRHETFIVVHSLGHAKRVGRNCLADFLGHHGDPRQLIGHLNLWGKAFEALEGAIACGIGSGDPTLNLRIFLSLVASEIRQHGWVSRSKVYERGYGQASADAAQSAYWNLGNPAEAKAMTPTAQDESKADGAIAWARALTDSDVEDSDYLYNLRAVCQDDYIRPKRGGLAGSAIVAAGRAFEKAFQAANDAQKSNEWVGKVKDRLTLSLTLVGTRDLSGFYGHTVLHRFEDAAGNLLIWFASNPEFVPAPECGHGKKRSMAIGETLTLKGTIKKQDDFQGRKQTVLNRIVVSK